MASAAKKIEGRFEDVSDEVANLEEGAEPGAG